jgi:hypothetical protein
MTDVADIAKSLTKAQREAVLHAAPGGFGYSKESLFHAGKRATGRCLLDKGLVDFMGRLSDRGIAVRAHIQGNPHD